MVHPSDAAKDEWSRQHGAFIDGRQGLVPCFPPATDVADAPGLQSLKRRVSHTRNSSREHRKVGQTAVQLDPQRPPN